MTKDLYRLSFRFFTSFRMTLLYFLLFLNSCAATKPPEILKTITDHQQVLFVNQSSTYKSRGNLSAWQKTSSSWQKVYSMPVALGRNGIAAKDAKKEGDGYTPSGIYLITTAFGYTDQINTKLNYSKVTDNDFWVDDINSPQYNQWVSGRPQAQSFEEMRRKDNLYAQGAIIEYNTNPIVPGKGSAIFLHIWRNYYKPTAGCVATSQRNIRRLLQWLDKDKGAMIVLFKA